MFVSDAEVESLWHSRVKAMVARSGEYHVAASGISDAECSHAHSAGLHGNRKDVKAATGKWLQRRLCRQSSLFPRHGNSDRRWIYSDPRTKPTPQPVKPHSEAVHVRVLNVRSTQCVGTVDAELINTSKPSKWERQLTVKSKHHLLKSGIVRLIQTARW